MSLLALTYNDTELDVLAPGFGQYSQSRVALPAGLVRLGRIHDIDLFSQTLQQALDSAQPHAIHASHVVVGLPEEQAFIKIVEMPAQLKQAELASAFEYQWQNLLPIGRDQVYFTFTSLPKPKTNVKKKKKEAIQQVLLLAYPREIINNILSVINSVGLTPERLIPLSFGLAELLSPTDSTIALVLKSDTDQDISVAIVQKSITHFSTIIHESITDPKAIKRIDNIRSYYESSTKTNENRIGRILIVPSYYTETLTQQVNSLSLPTGHAPIASILKIKPETEADTGMLFPLAGLLKSHFSVSIMPDDLQRSLLVKKQLTVFRTMLAYMTLSFGIILYLSLVFWASLKFNNGAKIHYAPTLTERVRNEGAKVNTEIGALNQKIHRLQTLSSQRTDLSSQVNLIAEKASAGGLTISSVAIDPAGKLLQVTGSRPNRDTLTTYIETLKAQKVFDKQSFDVTPESWLADGQSNFAFTIHQGGA